MIALAISVLFLVCVLRMQSRHRTELRQAYHAGIQKAVNEIGERQGIKNYHGQIMAGKERRN